MIIYKDIIDPIEITFSKNSGTVYIGNATQNILSRDFDFILSRERCFFELNKKMS